MERRSRIELLVDVLRLCVTPKIKTRITYEANLNFQLTGEVVDHLVEGGFLTECRLKGKTAYRTTEKGLSLLRYWKEFRRRFPELFGGGSE